MLVHYHCPDCGSDMAFDSKSGTLSCSNCGRQDDIDQFSEAYITNEFQDTEAKEYQCENCGAVIITDNDTTATACSFCEAPVVLQDRLTGKLAPQQVIPFKISKKEAQDAFVKWCRKGRLTPDGFMTANRIKNITGMYVPFWIYDLNSQVEFEGKGTKVRTYTRGDYIYTETKHYHIFRDIDLYYLKVPADASAKINDELMDKLEPYYYDDLKTFKTPYLAGYLAEKYNYDDTQLLPRVKEKISSFIDTYVRSTMRGYTTITTNREQIDTKNLQSAYVLFPVWMVVYDLDQQEYTFAMNGQTGKVVGKPPVSKKKVGMWFTGIAAAAFVVLKLIAFFISGVLW